MIEGFGDAKEYRDPDPSFGYDGTFASTTKYKTRKYIESTDNAEFEVVISVTDHPALDRYLDDHNGLQFTVFVDGEHMGRRFVRAHDISGRENGF